MTTYTGCLTVSGGTISLVAQGNAPLKPCGPGSVQISLSGGDITAVNAGTGLTGGGSNGDVSLSVAPSYQLPQSCPAGSIPSWNGTAWTCGSDTNTTYTAGIGVDLNGATFSVEPGYRIPQVCAAGQVAKSNGPNTAWSCAADNTGSAALPALFYTSYRESTDFGFLPGTGVATHIISMNVPAGNYFVTAVVEVSSPDTSVDAICDLLANGVEIWTSETWDDSETTNSLVLIAPAQLASGGTLTVNCTAGHENRGVMVRAALAAQQVGTVTVLPRPR